MDTTPVQKRARYPRAQREQILSQFAASGQTVDEFSAAHDLKPATLNRWLQQPHPKSDQAATLGFQAISLPAPIGLCQWAAEIALDVPANDTHPAQRHTLRLSHTAEPTWVANLIAVLRRVC